MIRSSHDGEPHLFKTAAVVRCAALEARLRTPLLLSIARCITSRGDVQDYDREYVDSCYTVFSNVLGRRAIIAGSRLPQACALDGGKTVNVHGSHTHGCS
jgi:hypothetical protein